MNPNLISKLLKNRRKHLGMNQEEFATQVGVALRLVRKLEQGHRNVKLEKVDTIMEFLGYELVPIRKNAVPDFVLYNDATDKK